jgi:hypothetical protein
MEEVVRMSEHKHTWEINKQRKHGRPPRVFVQCTECTATGQGVMIHGFLSVFRVNEKKYVKILVDITPKHKRMLEGTGNQSETVRAALDKYFE